ncbi:MAG: hypothetical protein F6K31_27270 [Symploca sp. SIO2G7]|nr:hypothetical protein [Symploca sp. SIO2G7]
MEELSKNVIEILESVPEIVDEFFFEVTEAVDVFADELQNTIGMEIEQYLQDMCEAIFELSFVFEDEFEDIWVETDPFFTDPVEPTPDKNSACVDCCHYHGQVYGGNLFVCAMYPYGWDAENCPDWESDKTDL